MPVMLLANLNAAQASFWSLIFAFLCLENMVSSTHFFILSIVSKTWLFFDPSAVLKVVQSYKELCMLCLNEMLVWNWTDSLLWKNQFAISNWMYLMLNLAHPTISRLFPVVKQKGPEN